MKILFLQKVDNAKGGITTVNLKLMTYFKSMNHQVDVLSVRHGDSWEIINYPQGVGIHLINSDDVWDCPRLNKAINFIKKGKFIKVIKLLISRISYEKGLIGDYERCQKFIEELDPDVIINSHYEVLAGISDDYLKKTVMHFHTSFDQVLLNRSYQKIFKEYANKIYKFVWLSKRTKEQAVKYGLKNSLYIYNPISFTEQASANINNKKLIFLGRLSEEKRVHLAIEYFQEIVQDKKYKDWKFEIYGDGPLKQSVLELIEKTPQIQYMGSTNNVQEVLLSGSLLILTSEFEGMPLVVLEANECGLPVIAYDFGESSREVIKDGETGIIVPQNNRAAFVTQLRRMLDDDIYRKSMGENAKQFADKFSVEYIGRQWQKLFDNME